MNSPTEFLSCAPLYILIISLLCLANCNSSVGESLGLQMEAN